MLSSDSTPNHAKWMGSLIVNLQSLELAFRGFLYNCEMGWTRQRGSRFIDDMAEGQQLEENAFTNYDTLRELIKKFNKEVQSRHLNIQVDPAIARIRDSLAHGRIASLSPSLDEPLRLVKYSKPSNNRVDVTDYHVLTGKWFDEQTEMVGKSIQSVVEAMALFEGQKPSS